MNSAVWWSKFGFTLAVGDALKAARHNRNRNYPQTEKGFYWKTLPQPGQIDKSNGQTCLKPKVLFLRRLDKAAVIDERTLPVSPKEQKEQVLGGHLCTAEQGREVKRLFTLIPIWTSFLGCSLVAATGNTFFYEQTSNMADNIKVPLEVLFALRSIICYIISFMFSSEIARQQHVTRIRIGVATDGLQEFFYNHVAISMRSYGPSFSDCVLGLGNFISMPFVLLCRSWFKDSINTSHLDKYYLTLAILSSVFFVFYVNASYSIASVHMGSPSNDEESNGSGNAAEGVELNEIKVDGNDDTTRSVSSSLRRRNVVKAATAVRFSLRLKNKLAGKSPANSDSPESTEEPLLQSHASTGAEEVVSDD